MEHTEDKMPKRKKYVKADVVAEYMGLKVTTIREYCSRKTIPHIKANGTVLFDLDDIEDWLQSRKVPVFATSRRNRNG